MAWTDTVFQFLGMGRYRSAPSALAEGEARELLLDATGRLRVSTDRGVGATRYRLVIPNGGAQIVAAPAKLLELTGCNTSAVENYLQIFDATSAPSGGAVPTLTYRIPASCPLFSITYYDLPVAFSAGIRWAVSSQPGTYSAGTATLTLEAVYS